MGIFSKTVYTDILSEYRKVKVGEFHMLDKVFVDKGYGKKIKGLILRIDSEGDYEYLELDGKTFWALKKHSITRDYGEFQTEMEALNESVALQKKAEALRKELIETTEKANKAYEKGKKMVNENMEALKIMKSPIIQN